MMTQKLGKDGGVESVLQLCRELERIGRMERYIRCLITPVKCLKIIANMQVRCQQKTNTKYGRSNVYFYVHKKQTLFWSARKVRALSISSMILLKRSGMDPLDQNSNTKKFLCSIPIRLFHRYRGRKNLRMNFLPYSTRRHERRISSLYSPTFLRSLPLLEISVPIS